MVAFANEMNVLVWHALDASLIIMQPIAPPPHPCSLESKYLRPTESIVTLLGDALLL